MAGDGYVTIGVGHWRMPGAHQTNLPVLGGGLAASDRWQINTTVPFYRLDLDGTTARGVDNVYFGTKYNLIDPMTSLHEVGLAVGAVVEVLNATASAGRTHVVIPVSAEIRRSQFRVYGSAGYFSRGAVFAGSAVDWWVSPRLTLTGAMTQSFATQSATTLAAYGVDRRRTDVSVGLTRAIGPQAAVFASLGKNLSGAAGTATPLAFSGGIALSFRGVRMTP